MASIITIAGIDRSRDIQAETITIEDEINDQQNTCSFTLIDRTGNGIPQTGDEVIIENNSIKIFAGTIQIVELTTRDYGTVAAYIDSVDYGPLFDSNLVHRTYQDMTDRAIIEDIVSRYCSGLGITTDNVLEGVTINQITFNYIQPSQAMRQLCELTGRNWYIDYDKDIHYFPLTTNTAPFNIDSTNTDYEELKIKKDASQIKNRVYVRGGTRLSDATSYNEAGDGEKRIFVLPDKPHNVSVSVNGSPQTLGIKNVDTSGFDWYLNFQEKYIEQDAGGTTLTTADTIEVTYQYDIPILVAVEDTDSISEYGTKEFAIFDKQISTTQAARDRATAELTDYANNVIEGSFSTFYSGFKSGQYININLSSYDVNEDYIVQKVRAASYGGGVFKYDIDIASAKTLGIIKFLIKLLEANKNLVELDDNESVDELFELTDSLNTDSLLDSLTIDSAGPYRTWCSDSLETTETRAVWNLFEWGGNS